MGPLRVSAQGKPHQIRHRNFDWTPDRDDPSVQPLRHPAPGPAGEFGRDIFQYRHAAPATNRSTTPTPSAATPNTDARRRTRSAHARCGRASFSLLPYREAHTPPPVPSARTTSVASAYSPAVTTMSA